MVLSSILLFSSFVLVFTDEFVCFFMCALNFESQVYVISKFSVFYQLNLETELLNLSFINLFLNQTHIV